MSAHDRKRHGTEPEQEEDRGTTWALPAIILAVAAILWASPDARDRVASNDTPSSGQVTTQAPK
jgi:hypothetical protein